MTEVSFVVEYMTVKEAAKRWDISERLAQRYCTEGRIDGVIKFSGSWAIPIDAKIPTDMRKESAKVEAEKPEEERCKHVPMPLMNTPFELGRCLETINKIEDIDEKNIALCEYYYFSGQSEKAAVIAGEYLKSNDFAHRLSACWIYAYANLALGRTEATRLVLDNFKKTLAAIDENAPADVRALAVCVSTGASVLLHLPLSDEIPPMKEFLYLLPPGLRLFALYVQAHYAYLQKAYGTSIGMVETALALQGEVYPIPCIYLHLVATMDYMSLREPEKAREHLLAAWHLAQKDDLIEAFGEHHGLLGGMLEAVIKKEWPDDFKRMISITYSFSAGWRKIHNPATGRSVADNLTTTEFAAAMLAARGWSNKEIGAHMGVSSNTVKQHISVALQMLGVTQRKELAQFMLN